METKEADDWREDVPVTVTPSGWTEQEWTIQLLTDIRSELQRLNANLEEVRERFSLGGIFSRRAK